MERTRRILTLVGLITISTAVICSQSFAEQKILPQSADMKKLQKPASAPKISIPKIPIPMTDLKIDAIHSSRCKYDLSDVDAFYVADIMVDVSNNYIQKGGGSTTAILKVTYHDLLTGHPVTVTKNISTLNPYPTDPWRIQMLKVVDHPVLVKKSTGIKAEIQITGMAADSNPSNNVKTVHKCQQMIY